MRGIHTSIVSQHLAARENYKILRTHPRKSAALLRHTRRTLAQLRTNKSSFLLSYLHKIDASTHPSPPCPLCHIHKHTTQHLFSCPQIHTTLSALDLWRDPSGVAALLDVWRRNRQDKRMGSPHLPWKKTFPLCGGGRGAFFSLWWAFFSIWEAAIPYGGPFLGLPPPPPSQSFCSCSCCPIHVGI